MLVRVNFPNFPVPSSLTLGDAMHQELRVAATTLVPWSDVVPDEIQNTELIAQVGGWWLVELIYPHQNWRFESV